MRANIECVRCAVDGVLRLLSSLEIEEALKKNILKKCLKLLAESDLSEAPVETSMLLRRIIKESTGIEDFFKDEKEAANNAMIPYYKKLKKEISKSDFHGFKKLILYSTGANIIDFGPIGHEPDFEKVTAEIEEKGFGIDHSEKLYQAIAIAEKIVYLLDNAGEALLDKLFIEFIKKKYPEKKVTAVVRGGPVLNDVTMQEALELGIDKAADKLIGNGSDAPGTLLSDISTEAKRELFNSDLIISKGQGNFETLYGTELENLYFLFMIKCDVVASSIKDANLHDLVAMKNYPSLKS